MLCNVHEGNGSAHYEIFKFSKGSDDIAISKVPKEEDYGHMPLITSGPQ
jgi:hypothetical protein